LLEMLGASMTSDERLKVSYLVLVLVLRDKAKM
jgi:hypothetical protein